MKSSYSTELRCGVPAGIGRHGIVDLHHDRLALDLRHGLAPDFRELAVDDEDLGLAMAEAEGDGGGVLAEIHARSSTAPSMGTP